MLKGKTEQEVTNIMEQHINDALTLNYFIKDIKSFETDSSGSVMVLIFERDP